MVGMAFFFCCNYWFWFGRCWPWNEVKRRIGMGKMGKIRVLNLVGWWAGGKGVVAACSCCSANMAGRPDERRECRRSGGGEAGNNQDQDQDSFLLFITGEHTLCVVLGVRWEGTAGKCCHTWSFCSCPVLLVQSNRLFSLLSILSFHSLSPHAVLITLLHRDGCRWGVLSCLLWMLLLLMMPNVWTAVAVLVVVYTLS